MGGATGGDEVRELRAQLQNARNDVMRYASRMRRLELQLAKQRGEAATAAVVRGFAAFNQASGAEVRVDEAKHAADAWTKVLKTAEQKLQKCSCSDGGHTTELSGLQRFLQQQQQIVVDLGRENAKLRDQLHARPTRSQLVTSQLEIEHLHDLLRELRSKREKNARQHAKGQSLTNEEASAEPTDKKANATTPVLEPLPSNTLTERISVDKLLSWLRVETKPLAKSMQRRFLKDPTVQCYLVLDPAALAAPTAASAITRKENVPVDQEQQQKDVMERKVGRICSEIVATCCHVLHVRHVGELPQVAQAVNRLASTIPTCQRFLGKLQELLHRLHEGKSTFALPRASFLPHEDLESLLERAEDVAVELEARRKYMNQTSGANAFDTLFELMTLLQAPHADQLQPVVLRLIESSRTEKLFVIQLRELLDLKDSATRDDICKIIAKLMQHLKITNSQQQPTNRSTHARPLQQQQTHKAREQ